MKGRCRINLFFGFKLFFFKTRKMQEEGTLNRQLLETIFHTWKKKIQEYVREIEQHNRYRPVYSNILPDTILDDRSWLINLYDACLQQDAHIRADIEAKLYGCTLLEIMSNTAPETGRLKEVNSIERRNIPLRPDAPYSFEENRAP